MIFQIKIITTVPVPISVSIIRKMRVDFRRWIYFTRFEHFLNIHVRAKNDFSNEDYFNSTDIGTYYS